MGKKTRLSDKKEKKGPSTREKTGAKKEISYSCGGLSVSERNSPLVSLSRRDRKRRYLSMEKRTLKEMEFCRRGSLATTAPAKGYGPVGGTARGAKSWLSFIGQVEERKKMPKLRRGMQSRLVINRRRIQVMNFAKNVA